MEFEKCAIMYGFHRSSHICKGKGVMCFADSRTGLADSRTELEIAFKQ